jgi:hypothetical protein
MAKEYVSGHVECFMDVNVFEVAIEWQCDPEDFTSIVRYEVVADIGYRFYGQPHSQPHSDRFKNFWWPAFQRVFHFDRRDELLERLKQLFQISPAVWANK